MHFFERRQEYELRVNILPSGNPAFVIFLDNIEIMFTLGTNLAGSHFRWTKLRAMVASVIAGLWTWTCNRRVKFYQDGEGSMYFSCHQAGNIGWKGSCWAGNICGCIHSEWRDGLWGTANLVDANMQTRLVSGCCFRFGDASSSMEDITVRSAPWHHLIDSFRRRSKAASCALSSLHDSRTSVTPADPLHQYVGKLLGMNLYTGLDGMTQNLDVKQWFEAKAYWFGFTLAS